MGVFAVDAQPPGAGPLVHYINIKSMHLTSTGDYLLTDVNHNVYTVSGTCTLTIYKV